LLVIALSAAAPFLRAKDDKPEDCPTVVGIIGQWWQIAQSGPVELHFAAKMKTCADGAAVACDEGSLVLKRDGDPNATAFHCHSDGTQRDLPPGAKYSFKIPGNSAGGGISKAWSRLALAVADPLIEYITPVSRGLEPELNDAVVSITGASVDVSAAFQGMDPGSYRVRLEPVSGGKVTAAVQVNWTEGSPARISVPGLSPGLYKLGELDANGQLAAPEAWILITRPEDFEKPRSTFQEALDATKKWPDEVDVRAPRAFLRQVLDGLSRHPAR
jgi:hypothetical protein